MGGKLKLWQGSTLEYRDELLFGKNLQETMALVPYSGKHLLLVVGGYDSLLHVYLVPKEGPKSFKYKFSLPGH